MAATVQPDQTLSISGSGVERESHTLSLSLSASALPASSQGPGQVAEVNRAPQASIRLQQ